MENILICCSSFHVFEGDANSYKDGECWFLNQTNISCGKTSTPVLPWQELACSISESTDHGSNESDTESDPSAPNTPHLQSEADAVSYRNSSQFRVESCLNFNTINFNWHWFWSHIWSVTPCTCKFFLFIVDKTLFGNLNGDWLSRHLSFHLVSECHQAVLLSLWFVLCSNYFTGSRVHEEQLWQSGQLSSSHGIVWHDTGEHREAFRFQWGPESTQSVQLETQHLLAISVSVSTTESPVIKSSIQKLFTTQSGIKSFEPLKDSSVLFAIQKTQTKEIWNPCSIWFCLLSQKPSTSEHHAKVSEQCPKLHPGSGKWSRLSAHSVGVHGVLFRFLSCFV